MNCGFVVKHSLVTDVRPVYQPHERTFTTISQSPILKNKSLWHDKIFFVLIYSKTNRNK